VKVGTLNRTKGYHFKAIQVQLSFERAQVADLEVFRNDLVKEGVWFVDFEGHTILCEGYDTIVAFRFRFHEQSMEFLGEGLQSSASGLLARSSAAIVGLLL
jgi:hypothetical protein